MTHFPVFVIVLLTSFSSAAAEPAPWSIDGGTLTLSFSGNVSANLGLEIVGRPGREGEITVELPIGDQGSLEFLAPGGHFQKLLGGSLPLSAPLPLRWSGDSVAETVLRLAPAPGHPPALQLIDVGGGSWLTLEYGHFQVDEGRLQVRAMDLRVGLALAAALGEPTLTGLWVGGAELTTAVNRPASAGVTVKGACTTPEWPTEPGNDADLVMIKMDHVNQIIRQGGRVALAPSASFRNMGTADLPWYAMFATTSSDSDCIDSGDGVSCQPYANDQGGILAYALYRLNDGRLEQLGRSDAKHAFNSVNENCLPCSGGRIVWQGCEDIYNVGLNAERDFLGPRSEITAHTGVWQRSGSIFDQNGDGVCDHPSSTWFGGVRCQAPAADDLDRRLHVAESDLGTPGARYFVESWYVVRDDIDIFNSMGFQEITPTFNSSVGSGTWTFPCTGGPCTTTFTQGPVVDELFPVNATTSVRFSAGGGQENFQLITRSDPLGGGRHRYDLMIVNFDFDRQFRRIGLPLPLGARASAFAFQDGDTDTANDWSVGTAAGELSWTAPPGTGLDWGSLYTFSFEASLPPVNGSVELIPREAGGPTSFDVNGLNLLDDVIHLDGFEG